MEMSDLIELIDGIHEVLTNIKKEISELRARVEVLESKGGQTKGTSRFTPPTLMQVRLVMVEYCRDKGYRTDANPREFIDFYQSNGWKVGRVSMKDWQAAVRNWCRRNRRVENKKGTEAYHRHGL